MYIVTLVTVGAACGHVDLLYRFAMAGIAVQPLMGPIQFILSLGVVVEAPQAPPIGIVADAAFWT